MKFETATNYDEFATAQKLVAKDLAEALKCYGSNYENVFEIGCGSGIFTRHLQNEFSCKNLTVNDLYMAKPMYELPHVIGDIQTTAIPGDLNLVASSSVLQWIDALEDLFKRIHASLQVGGILAVGLFTQGTLEELESYTHQGLVYRNKDQLNEIATKYFSVKTIQESKVEVPFENIHDMLNSLKQTGVNNLNGTFRLTKETYRGLVNHFKGNVKLSYNYVVLVAQKKTLG